MLGLRLTQLFLIGRSNQVPIGDHCDKPAKGGHQVFGPDEEEADSQQNVAGTRDDAGPREAAPQLTPSEFK